MVFGSSPFDVQTAIFRLEQNHTLLGKKYTALQQQYATLTSSMSSLQSKYTSLQQEAASLSSQIATLKSQNAALTSQLSTANANVTALEQQISAKNVQISSLTSQLSTANSTITSLNTQITSFKAQITTLTSTISSLNSQITSMGTQITTLKSTISADASKITSLNNTITLLNTKITTLTSQITSLNGTISTLTSDVAKYKAAALRIIAAPTASVTQGAIPLSVDFAPNLNSNPLQVPTALLGNLSYNGGIIDRIRARFGKPKYEIATSRIIGTGGGGSVTGGGGTIPPPTFTLPFVESGLPSGTKWSVAINGSTISSTSDTLNVYVHSTGTYSYTVPQVSGYTASPASGKITTNSGSVTITYTAVTTSTPPSSSSTPTITYAWAFGDGGTSSEASPSYTFITPGTFTPTLTITISVNGKTYTHTFVLPSIVAALRIPNAITIGPAQSQGNCNNKYKLTFTSKSNQPCAYTPYMVEGNNLGFPNGIFSGKADVNGNAYVVLHQCVCGSSGFKVRSLLAPSVTNTASYQPPCF